MGLSARAEAFFDSYLAAFEQMDAAAIAGHIAFPFHMTSEGDDVGQGADLYDFHAVYRLAEVDGGTRIAALAHDELPRALAFATRRR